MHPRGMLQPRRGNQVGVIMQQNMKKNETLLVIDDEPEVANYIRLSLRYHGYVVESVQNGHEALQFLDQAGGRVALVLLDVLMPRMDGIETLRQLRRSPRYKNLPVIMLSGASSTATVVEAMKHGANDFVLKPVSHTELASVVQKALSAAGEHPASSLDRVRPTANSSRFEYHGPSAWMVKMQPLLQQVGASDAPVLIQGETGVGKEVVAKLLHSRSSRAGKPFLKLNCAALPSELVESELFGFERGAFTGAFKSKPGKFDQANTGTLLLDEIGDMDFKLQAKLLQVLQDQQFERLGGKETVEVDVRIMAATHCDLEEAIAVGRFREDLYHRLNVINIRVPPLRERTDEILPLAEYFVAKHSTEVGEFGEITPDLRRALIAYSWPGNIRELENFVRRFRVLRDPEMATEELQMRTQRKQSAYESQSLPAATPVLHPIASLPNVAEAQRRMESQAILNALNATHWNRKLAAARLNVDYKALLYKMKKLGIESDERSEVASA